jgi:hypothetical protein
MGLCSGQSERPQKYNLPAKKKRRSGGAFLGHMGWWR